MGTNKRQCRLKLDTNDDDDGRLIIDEDYYDKQNQDYHDKQPGIEEPNDNCLNVNGKRQLMSDERFDEEKESVLLLEMSRSNSMMDSVCSPSIQQQLQQLNNQQTTPNDQSLLKNICLISNMSLHVKTCFNLEELIKASMC